MGDYTKHAERRTRFSGGEFDGRQNLTTKDTKEITEGTKENFVVPFVTFFVPFVVERFTYSLNPDRIQTPPSSSPAARGRRPSSERQKT